MIGKAIRLERIMNRKSHKTVMVPLFHGVGFGPIEGIKDIMNTVDVVSLGGANAVILHKGIVRSAHRRAGEDIGLVIQLTATTHEGGQVLVTEVEEAVRLGADAISVRIEVGGPDEPQMLALLGKVAKKASELGMPLLALMHPRPEREAKKKVAATMRAARIGAELGADVIRAPYTGSPGSFQEVVESCPAPMMAIGATQKIPYRNVLNMVQGAIKAGACGVSLGRRVFQHQKPGNVIKAVSDIVHLGKTVEKAMAVLKEKPITSSVTADKAFGSVFW